MSAATPAPVPADTVIVVKYRFEVIDEEQLRSEYRRFCEHHPGWARDDLTDLADIAQELITHLDCVTEAAVKDGRRTSTCWDDLGLEQIN